MSRLPIPASIEAAPAASQPLLQAVKKQLGVVPNSVSAWSATVPPRWKVISD